MKAIIILTSLLIIPLSYCNKNYCKRICKDYINCIEQCEEYSSDPTRSSVELPQCGITLVFPNIDKFNNGTNTRIVDGLDAEKYEFPWMVSIQMFRGVGKDKTLRPHVCGGVIINSRFILTAAHCLKPGYE
jgi:hypothetical protein